MAKLYIREKDLNGAKTVTYNGECYTLTGNGVTPSQLVTETSIGDVSQTYDVQPTTGYDPATSPAPTRQGPSSTSWSNYLDGNTSKVIPWNDPPIDYWLHVKQNQSNTIITGSNMYGDSAALWQMKDIHDLNSGPKGSMRSDPNAAVWNTRDASKTYLTIFPFNVQVITNEPQLNNNPRIFVGPDVGVGVDSYGLDDTSPDSNPYHAYVDLNNLTLNEWYFIAYYTHPMSHTSADLITDSGVFNYATKQKIPTVHSRPYDRPSADQTKALKHAAAKHTFRCTLSYGDNLDGSASDVEDTVIFSPPVYIEVTPESPSVYDILSGRYNIYE